DLAAPVCPELARNPGGAGEVQGSGPRLERSAGVFPGPGPGLRGGLTVCLAGAYYGAIFAIRTVASCPRKSPGPGHGGALPFTGFGNSLEAHHSRTTARFLFRGSPA